MTMAQGNSLKVGDIILPETVIVLEFSRSQLAYHVQPLIDHIRHSLTSFVANKPNDWVILGIFPDHETCDKFYEEIIRIHKRNEEMSPYTIDELIKQLG